LVDTVREQEENRYGKGKCGTRGDEGRRECNWVAFMFRLASLAKEVMVCLSGRQSEIEGEESDE